MHTIDPPLRTPARDDLDRLAVGMTRFAAVLGTDSHTGDEVRDGQSRGRVGFQEESSTATEAKRHRRIDSATPTALSRRGA